ncbi:RNA polymerase sigma factor [Planctomycetota bacterium]
MENDTLTDEQLMAAVAGGDMGSLGLLVRRHQGQALALAYRTLRRWDQAEDVVQEAFLRVHKAAKRYRPEAKFTTWFYRIVVNLCLDEKRRSRRTGLNIADLPELQSTHPQENPSALQENNERAQKVWQALERLNKRQRMAVVLHRFQGLSHQQVAEATGWSASAVESLLVRAYRNLRRDLADLQQEGF